jgi:hypothetical protein
MKLLPETRSQSAWSVCRPNKVLLCRNAGFAKDKDRFQTSLHLDGARPFRGTAQPRKRSRAQSGPCSLRSNRWSRSTKTLRSVIKLGDYKARTARAGSEQGRSPSSLKPMPHERTFSSEEGSNENAEEPLFNLLTTVDTTNFVIVLPESIVIKRKVGPKDEFCFCESCSKYCY